MVFTFAADCAFYRSILKLMMFTVINVHVPAITMCVWVTLYEKMKWWGMGKEAKACNIYKFQYKNHVYVCICSPSSSVITVCMVALGTCIYDCSCAVIKFEEIVV